MINIYLDIETIPSQSQEYRDEVRRNIKPPAKYKKPESIATWLSESGESAADEVIAKTSFDPALGHICCLSYAIEDEPVKYYDARDIKDEVNILKDFFGILPEIGLPRFVGHYVAQFDLRFILCRAVVLGVEIPGLIPRDPKPWDDTVFDTMTAWAGAKGSISQDKLAKTLGFPGKGDFDGSMVAKAWENGEYARIAEYCMDDVKTVRHIHKCFQEVGF